MASDPASKDFVHGMIRYYDDRAPVYDRSMGYDRPDAAGRHVAVLRFLRQELKDRSVLEIASGPGFWTSELAPDCRSILATDVNSSTQDEARKKLAQFENVKLQVQDAYGLRDLPPGLNGAFAVDWWSHIPKSQIASFLGGLHQNLEEGSRIVFVDQLDTPEHPSCATRQDEEGNLIEPRRLPDGRSYEIIKNYPSESELKSCVGIRGRDFAYLQDLAVHRWAFAYSTTGSD